MKEWKISLLGVVICVILSYFVMSWVVFDFNVCNWVFVERVWGLIFVFGFLFVYMLYRIGYDG